jgi:hypothetical protein
MEQRSLDRRTIRAEILIVAVLTPGAALREIVFPEIRVSKMAITEAMKRSRNQRYLILGEKPTTPEVGSCRGRTAAHVAQHAVRLNLSAGCEQP